MPQGFGNTVFHALISVPAIHRFVNRWATSRQTDSGPLPGVFTAKQAGKTSLWEILHKEYFALIVPTPDAAHKNTLPKLDDLKELFRRTEDFEESRVSVLLPFFAQHLTDAVFQSENRFETNAPHEIILNQIYGNTPQDTACLRSHEDGKLRTQVRPINGGAAEYPDALLEKVGEAWQVKEHFKNLSYLTDEKITTIKKKYEGDEGDVCATGLYQGNLTLGNFAITTLLVREHNRLCEGILAEHRQKGLPTDDETIFRCAQQNNVTAYMKVVIEDYINAFAGQKLFILDTKSFFHEKKRWCRETPLPFHFNVLYRIHSMIPSHLKGYEDAGFKALLANNQLVMKLGIGKTFELASAQGAGQVRLGNTHEKLLDAELAGLEKAREVLGAFNAHREVQEAGSSLGFEAFDPAFRDKLKELYGNDPSKVDYAVGIFAELPKPGLLEKLGVKDDPIIGSTLMNAIAKHAFRHILSNRFMTREYLNPEMLTDFGWANLHATSTVADLVKRNVAGEMDIAQAEALKIGFAGHH